MRSRQEIRRSSFYALAHFALEQGPVSKGPCRDTGGFYVLYDEDAERDGTKGKAVNAPRSSTILPAASGTNAGGLPFGGGMSRRGQGATADGQGAGGKRVSSTRQSGARSWR